MLDTIFNDQLPITFEIPWSAKGRNRIPSLQPNSKTVASFGFKNLLVNSLA